MGRWTAILFALLFAVTYAQDKTPTFTDAQLLKAAKHKAAVLEYQLAVSSLEQRKQQLVAQQTALNAELCGSGTFDFDKELCVAKPEEKK